MGKLGYKKSRTGCQKCKTRRVKCDERVPCSACKKHGVQCSLQYPTPSETSPSGGSVEGEDIPSKPKISKRLTRGRKAANSDKPLPPRCIIMLTQGYPSNLPDIEPEPWIEDLELMHHYTSASTTIFPTASSTHAVFKEIVPQVAFRFPYLLHQVLAMSAFHLAHLNPERRQAYRIRAVQHQTKSIGLMREALEGEFTESNVYALFATSAFLMGSVFASNTYEESADGYDSLMERMMGIATLLKGTMMIQKKALSVLDKSSASSHSDAEVSAWEPDSPLLRDIGSRMEHLKHNIIEYQVHDPYVKATIFNAVEDMTRAMKTSARPRISPSAGFAVVFMWPSLVSDDYMALLRDKHPAAMAIFLLYCVVLKSKEDEFWLLKGWGANLGLTISGLLVESPWAEFKAWPLERIMSNSV